MRTLTQRAIAITGVVVAGVGIIALASCATQPTTSYDNYEEPEPITNDSGVEVDDWLHPALVALPDGTYVMCVYGSTDTPPTCDWERRSATEGEVRG